MSDPQNVLRTLPTEAGARKAAPMLTGLLDYFPLALDAVARISKVGNDQHNPGEPLHWARGKSTDHGDCVVRHLIERGTIDSDGQRHTAKAAWRILALLQEELEAAAGWKPKPSDDQLIAIVEQRMTPEPTRPSYPPVLPPKYLGHKSVEQATRDAYEEALQNALDNLYVRGMLDKQITNIQLRMADSTGPR